MTVQRAELETKAWGDVRHAFNTPYCAVSVLHVNDGFCCSRHRHRDRVNRFMVVSGVIDVIIYEDDGETEFSRHALLKGDVFDVPAGTFHRFNVIQSGVVVEVYWPETPDKTVRQDDIERLDVGGRIEELVA